MSDRPLFEAVSSNQSKAENCPAIKAMPSQRFAPTVVYHRVQVHESSRLLVTPPAAREHQRGRRRVQAAIWSLTTFVALGSLGALLRAARARATPRLAARARGVGTTRQAWLIRHAEYTLPRNASAFHDFLNATGHARAAYVARLVASGAWPRFSHVLCSTTQRRTYETALPIAAALGVPVQNASSEQTAARAALGALASAPLAPVDARWLRDPASGAPLDPGAVPANGAFVLVVWEHCHFPVLRAALGDCALGSCRECMPQGHYDDVHRLELAGVDQARAYRAPWDWSGPNRTNVGGLFNNYRTRWLAPTREGMPGWPGVDSMVPYLCRGCFENLGAGCRCHLPDGRWVERPIEDESDLRAHAPPPVRLRRE